MISKGARECFVYITLPGQTEFVTAARFALGTDRAGNPRGELVYGRSYLARTDAVPIDPIELKLAPVTYQTLNLKGVFGALRDASPDYWGRRVIESSGSGEFTDYDGKLPFKRADLYANEGIHEQERIDNMISLDAAI